MKNKQFYIDFNNGRLCNSGGASLLDLPSVIMGSKPTIEFHFVDWSDGISYLPDMTDATTFTAAIDTDLDVNTDPMTVTASGDIVTANLVSGVIEVPVDGTASGFISKVNGKDTLPAWMELYGKDSNGNIIYDYRFRINARGTVIYSGDVPPSPEPPDPPTPTPTTDTMTLVVTHPQMGQQTLTLTKTAIASQGKAWWCSDGTATSVDDAKPMNNIVYWDGSKWLFFWTSSSSDATLENSNTDYPTAGTYTCSFGMFGDATVVVSYNS